jgi:polyhydroxyalkanoate synthesis regulator phasin
LVADGDIDDAEAESLIEKLRAQGRKIPLAAQPLEEKLQNILSKRGIPSREELTTLNQQIDALADKIDKMNRET